MKYFATLILFFSFLQQSQAQLSQSELDSLKVIWTDELNAEIENEGIGTDDDGSGWSPYVDSIYAEYAKDTFLINGICLRQLEADQTTVGMVRAMADCEAGYDQLMNKYYKALLRKLSKEDQEILKKTQRNWLAMRTSERELSALLTEEKYSGGGTIQQLFYSDWNLEFTKHRVEEMLDYLTRFAE